ncbi:MAG: aminodeoxychorismate lyase, partial [Sneathiella sp.]
MKRTFYFIAALFLVVAVIAGGLAGYSWHLFKSPGPLAEETTFLVEKGTGLRELAVSLKNNGIITNELPFIFGVKIEEKGRQLRAGEYRMPVGISGYDVMNLFVSGKVLARRITIPEGLQSREIRELVMQAAGLEGEITIAMPEGAFLPETYHYNLGDSRDELVARMAEDMRVTTERLWNNATPPA